MALGTWGGGFHLWYLREGDCARLMGAAMGQQMREERRFACLGCLLAVGLTTVAAVAALHFIFFDSVGGTGSMAEAVRLRAILEPIPDPEAGRGCDPEFSFHRFPNGEWVMGIARDSHASLSRYRGGGTVVMKDSRGRVRCFFGHVCGSGRIDTIEGMRGVDSLDDFDARLAKDSYRVEQAWP